MMRHALLATGLACACGTTASAAIFFTFEDPSTVREVSYTVAPGGGSAMINYSSDAPVELKIDGTQEGIPVVLEYSAILTMNINVGASSPLGGIVGGFEAPISGEFFFTLDDGGAQEILRGTFDSGGLITLGAAGALITTDATGLVYTPSGPLLDEIMDAGFSSFFAPHDAVFTLTDITPMLIVGQNGFFQNFTANAAYTGTTNVPTPGALALGALAMISMTRRRR